MKTYITEEVRSYVAKDTLHDYIDSLESQLLWAKGELNRTELLALSEKQPLDNFSSTCKPGCYFISHGPTGIYYYLGRSGNVSNRLNRHKSIYMNGGVAKNDGQTDSHIGRELYKVDPDPSNWVVETATGKMPTEFTRYLEVGFGNVIKTVLNKECMYGV